MFSHLLLVGIATVLALVLFVLSLSVTRKVPVSFSATFYSLEKHGWALQLLLVFLSLALLPLMVSICKDHHEWLAFLSCASLLFVASAPAFKAEMEGKVHYSAAIICCMCAVLWQILEGLWDVMLCFAWTGGMLSLIWQKQWCWFMECAVMGSLIVNLWRLVC